MLRNAITAIATTMLLAGAAIAQQPPAAAPPPPDFSKVEIKTTDLGDNIYMLEGQGGNITVAVAKDGIIMVDSEYAPLHDKIKAAISTVSNQPIKYLINTHFHGDHTGGNAPFAKDGVTVVAEINVKNRLAAGTTNGLTGAKTPPAPPDALPSKTYTKTLQIRLLGRVADLRHIDNAHTDGDTYVWFKTANVLSTGDTFTNGRYPNIDFANGGNIKGMIAATDVYLKLTNAKTRIVPGHGPLADKAALTEYRTMLVTARDRMAKLVKEGKSEDDVVAAKPFADLDAKWAPTELAARILSASSGIRLRTRKKPGRRACMKDLVAIAEKIAARLIERRQTIAVAESSTGGLISAALLAVPGASAYFLGGAVVYTRDARRILMEIPDDAMKGIRSASEPYAKLLASQIRRRFSTDWGLSETGATGPTGNRYGDAAGHSCMAVAGTRSTAMTLETGSADRLANMHVFASTALNFLLQNLAR